MPKAKPYSGPVDDKLAAQLLNSTGATYGDEPLGDALIEARRRVQELVKRANDELEGSDFATIVAEHLATQMNRRGNAVIGVADDGQTELYISYEDQPARRPKQQRDQKLPLLEDLRAKAAELGVDIGEFGIKRKKIWEHLQAVEAGEIKGKPVPKKRSKGPKAKPKPKSKPEVKVAEDEAEDDPGPMSAGPDETKVSPPPDDPKPPKKRAIVKTEEDEEPVVRASAEAASDPKKGPNPAESQDPPDMRKLVRDSKEVSITDLLQSEPPKQ
jgi:hypothetical protein